MCVCVRACPRASVPACIHPSLNQGDFPPSRLVHHHHVAAVIANMVNTNSGSKIKSPSKVPPSLKCARLDFKFEARKGTSIL